MISISDLLESACTARDFFFDKDHVAAFRLLNGFLEGFPPLSLDIYARTILIHNYAPSSADDQAAAVQAWILEKLPWVQCIVTKTRSNDAKLTPDQVCGNISFGKTPDRKIIENGIWYAINLTMNRDASFYIDTRNLRAWAKNNLFGKTVLNTFAYTGSLGVAALAGGAKRVVQLDRNPAFLKLARQSYALNGFPHTQDDFLIQDFFPAVGQLKRSKQTFDCVFLDPPFFASTNKGTVDLEAGNNRLINKIRPLINDGGWLVAINNALYVSGHDYLASLEALCLDGYLTLEQLIPIPSDYTGYAHTPIGGLPVDPAPFNHSTKIAVLRVFKKPKPDQP
jgi:23S rRNA (cytosine1962-C5)-methyltransferase